MTRRLLPLATVCAFVLAAAPAVAGSTVKPKSGTYKGTLTAPRTEYAITLTVANGKLTKATVSNIPFYCSSGGPAIPVKFAGSKIATSNGAFSTTGHYTIKVGPYKGKVGEKLKLSGRFSSKGTVSGVLATTFVLNGPKCTGKNAFTAAR
ncbi:MAG: hypothetical protein WB761_29555 [Solirubrobacteraceae bacterium]